MDEQQESPLHVIVAEDDAANRMVLCRMLTQLNCKITRAVNGMQALQHAQTCNAKALFMDLAMPSMDGIAATKAIREDPRLADLRVIAVTGDVRSETRAACERAGFNTVLTKPVRIETLATILHKE